ncbi:MAG: hypothetical protein LH606_05575 [Cytophagaceae bacterium]|nr:hypothetical protein [Cytophagaceae bacterium]
METTFTLRRDELDAEFLESVKKLFRNHRELQITISASTDFGLNAPESRQEYFQRLEKAVENLEKGQDQVILNEEEFDTFSLNKLSK